MGGYYLVVVGGDYYVVIGVVEVVGGFVLDQVGDVCFGYQVVGVDQDWQVGCCCGDGGGVGFGEFMMGEVY